VPRVSIKNVSVPIKKESMRVGTFVAYSSHFPKYPLH
jgi:hypothetical protein